jgi:hypothetical protein
VFFDSHAFRQVNTLRLVGLTKREDTGSTYQDLLESRALGLLPELIRPVLVCRRLSFGNTSPLKVTIMLDTTPESEVEAVWYTYKVTD